MVTSAFWKNDWFTGLVVSVLVLLAGNGDLLQSLERKAYDLGIGATTRTPSERIAVVTDSSRARTGMVLGTPSYMSPEQLAEHKIDGRSDLFPLALRFVSSPVANSRSPGNP